MYCPICGNKLEGPFARGDICNCCGNEARYDDDITFRELKRFTFKDFKMSRRGAKRFKPFDEALPLDIAHDLLRAKWINNGCKWRYNSYGEKPVGWNLEMAKQQLRNINIDIEEYLSRRI